MSTSNKKCNPLKRPFMKCIDFDGRPSYTMAYFDSDDAAKVIAAVREMADEWITEIEEFDRNRRIGAALTRLP